MFFPLISSFYLFFIHLFYRKSLAEPNRFPVRLSVFLSQKILPVRSRKRKRQPISRLSVGAPFRNPAPAVAEWKGAAAKGMRENACVLPNDRQPAATRRGSNSLSHPEQLVFQGTRTAIGSPPAGGRVEVARSPARPFTQTKKGSRSLDCLFGADDEARTRYLHLGKVALYQMSYIRIFACPDNDIYYTGSPVGCQLFFSKILRISPAGQKAGAVPAF